MHDENNSKGESMPLSTYQNTVNQKPSVLDAIVLQGATQVPFLKWMGRGKITAPKHSWITDRIRDPQANFNHEVSDLEENTQDTKVMHDNVTHIVKNEFGLSRRELDNARYGQKEWPYRVSKNAKEHAKDMEYALLGLHNDSVFDNYTQETETTPAKMAGIFHYVPDHNRQDFKDGDGNPVDFTFDHLHQALEPLWKVGGLEDESFMIIMSARLKHKLNLFAKDYLVKDMDRSRTYDPTISRVVTDFGTVTVKIHRLFGDAKLQDKILIGKLSEARMMFLTPTEFKEVPTSKTAKFGRYYTDFTLEVRNPDYFACAEGLK